MPTSRSHTHILRLEAIQLQDDYYKQHETVCDICFNDETSDCGLDEASATVSNSEANLRAISPTSIIRTAVCRHVFHERCLKKWLQEQTTHRLHGNCPMCRGLLIFNPRAIACARTSEAHRTATTQRRSRDDESTTPSAFRTTHTQGDALERERLQPEEPTALARQRVIYELTVEMQRSLRELNEALDRLRSSRRTLLQEELLRAGEERSRLGEEHVHFLEEQRILELQRAGIKPRS